MARIKNQHLYGTKKQIEDLKEEHDWIGRHVTRIKPPSSENNNMWELVVYALPPKKKPRPKTDDDKTTRSRRPRRGNGFNRYKEVED